MAKPYPVTNLNFRCKVFNFSAESDNASGQINDWLEENHGLIINDIQQSTGGAGTGSTVTSVRTTITI